MKKIQNRLAALLFLITCGQFVQAQTSNLVVFSESNELFTLVLNGARVNNVPTANVKVTGLTAAPYQLQLLFNNPSIPPLQTTLPINPGTEKTFALMRASNGGCVMQFINEFSLQFNPVPPANQQVLLYTGPVNGGMPHHTIVGGNTGAPSGTSGGFNIDVNVGNSGNGGQGAVGNGTSTTTTTTTTVIEETPVEVVEELPNPLPGYNGPIGCDYPMDPDAFDAAKSSISSKSFSDSKMRIAKQVVGANCVLSSQVRELMSLFSFESDKLDFAKFAYDYTYDRGNYYKVNDGFSFESSIDELDRYLDGK